MSGGGGCSETNRCCSVRFIVPRRISLSLSLCLSFVLYLSLLRCSEGASLRTTYDPTWPPYFFITVRVLVTLSTCKHMQYLLACLKPRSSLQCHVSFPLMCVHVEPRGHDGSHSESILFFLNSCMCFQRLITSIFAHDPCGLSVCSCFLTR